MTASAALLVPLLIDRSGEAGAPADQHLQDDFRTAADEYHVPRSVLMGVSYLQSRWDSHPGVPSVVGGYGPMHLVDARGLQTQQPDRPAARPRTATAPPPAARRDGSPAGSAGPPADLRRAAGLIGLPTAQLRTDEAANIRGGAALLAATQRQLGKPLSANPADWWEAVARFSGTSDRASATVYADDVFDVIRRGAHRTTDAGQRVGLAASPRVRRHPPLPQGPQRPKEVECPAELSCSWLSAPYAEIDDDSYGNHQPADRPKDQRIEYIVIHDTEAPLTSMLQTIQDPEEASWHYSIRSSDGHITQHVKIKDAAWHSGSQFVNARSIGIEHEGFLRQPDAWYTEQMYRSSARLVKYLAKKYGVPLDRQHVFGHDNVPAPTEDSIPDMHDDPGPFWDWRHYFDLLGAPLRATAGPDSDIVMILPDYAQHKPLYTGCAKTGVPCAPHGSSAVRLHTEPNDNAPLIQDPGRHPDGEDSTVDVNDLGSRVSAGQTFAVAERGGDWTAIWYQGRKAWFKNPKERPTAVGARGSMVTPKEGMREVEVFGRALPEEDAFPEEMDEMPEPSPLPYTLRAGQRYVTRSRVLGSYLEKPSSDGSPSPVVQGEEAYYEIQLGHRLAYVRAADVDVVSTPAAAGPPGHAARTPLR
ncbi:amidase [Streptomyces griseochromogenes]|uniref:N-acetylmuramoyl-L-alanine amidase n=1 Tax=Streptomyces griseochromogenes TaxID=68214 RepID=A0A1B1BDM1_9ACTN|nr:amidase [Streptomyces griseochromogenes]